MMNRAVDDLNHTPLYERHLELGARMVPFGGWAMPVQYSGIIEEHLHARENAALGSLTSFASLFFNTFN